MVSCSDSSKPITIQQHIPIRNKMTSTPTQLIERLSEHIRRGKQTALGFISALNAFRHEYQDAITINSKNNSYMIGNYYIVPGYINKKSQFFDNLKFLNRAGFCRTSAPELVNVFESADNNFGIAIYKLNDTQGGLVVPYNKVADQIPIESKQRFLDEQIALLKSTSLYNPAVTESQFAWGVTPDSKSIYIDSWSELKKSVSPEQTKAIIDRLKVLLK